MYRCNGGTHSIETVDAWSTHSIAHGLETKMQMLNLEKEERGGRGKRREEGDSCHIITIFQQLYTIVSSLIFLLSSYCGLKFGGNTLEIFSPQFR